MAATVLEAPAEPHTPCVICQLRAEIEIRFDAAGKPDRGANGQSAADLLLRKEVTPEQEIDKVTTPKGCTIAGLK